jgi:ubiquinone/menaquinone biosynthesis C-methylase UbiE
MASSDEQEYLLRTSDEELVRLGSQHGVWAELAFALWERAGFAPGQTILDLGCGPGYTTLDLASLVGPSGRVIAIDESRRFLDFFEAQQKVRGVTNVETRCGDVQKIDLPAGSIDGAYARWVLCYLKEPEEVVARVARALRPGGAMAVLDYFHYLGFTHGPRSAALDRVAVAVQESVRSRGGDLDMMGHLPAMMARHGLTVKEIAPVVRVARPGSALWEWPIAFFNNFLPVLVEGGFLTEHEAQAFQDDWKERSNNPSAFLLTPPMLEVIGVKA